MTLAPPPSPAAIPDRPRPPRPRLPTAKTFIPPGRDGATMLPRDEVLGYLDGYDLAQVKVGAFGSHSALDVCDGAVAEGFTTVCVCEQGRHRTYADHFRAKRDTTGAIRRGCVDEAIVLDSFSDLIDADLLQRLRTDNVLLVPNRSLVSYLGIDAVEDELALPLVGSRNLLRSEEREEEENYYSILEKAGLPFPPKVDDPDDIDGLVIVKLHHAEKRLERGFFTAASPEEYHQKANRLIDQGVITADALEAARIEEYIVGPVFNFDFFYSPLEHEMSPLELLGVDWRFESSLDGHVRLPADQQLELPDHQKVPEMTVVGHNSATARESLLEAAFELGEKFVDATQEYYDPGIIGPFCLQTCVDKDMDYTIYDVAPRVGGGTNIHMAVGHPYGNTLWRREMSTGRRVAMEVRRAIERDEVQKIVT